MASSRSSSNATVIELFAGVGGFRLGLEVAGWQTVWSNQWEPSTKEQHASACYVANFGTEGHSNEDIELAINLHEERAIEIPDADLIVGGFPCQDYSVAKSLTSSQGLQGKKGVLWWQIHRLVQLKNPKFIFLENVDRLLKSPSSQRGRDFAVMLKTLGDLGYAVEWRVVNSAEYGFPQRRIRVFIVATRLDLTDKSAWTMGRYEKEGILPLSLPATEYVNRKVFDLDGDAEEISTSFSLGATKSPFLEAGFYLQGRVETAKPLTAPIRGRVLRDVLIPDSEVPDDFWIEDSKLEQWEFLKGAKSLDRVSKGGHVYRYSEGKMAFPDSLDKPSRTILTGEGGATPSRFKHVVRTDKGYRRLMPIELERLNGFPDNWTRVGADGKILSDARRAFFMGNALVVGLIEKVAVELMSRLKAQASL